MTTPSRPGSLWIAALTAAFFLAGATTPALATEPGDASAKIALADAANLSRVLKDRYLVQTQGSPAGAGVSTAGVKAARDQAAAAVKATGARVTASFDRLWNGFSVTATQAQIEILARNPSVAAVFPVYRVDQPTTIPSPTKASSALNTIGVSESGPDGAGVKVGVIDTGIDYHHPDLGGKPDSKFPTGRVAYGYDFIDSESAPDDCAGHGTHVAGIIGADGDPDTGGVRGVAPGVTLGAYRVFDCEGGTGTDIIMEALEKAYYDGMDVVNLSLGIDFGNWTTYPLNLQVTAMVNKGVVVVAAAGNAGGSGLFAVGWPAASRGVISVASYEPETITARTISVDGQNYFYGQVLGTATPPTSGTLALQSASKLQACEPLSEVEAGTALLIKRGTCTFREKITNATNAGATAAVIFNSEPGFEAFSAEAEDEPDLTIPAIAISGSQGENLVSQLADPGSLTMGWHDFTPNVPNPNGSRLSGFSSAGLTADLRLSPTITAPGGSIYSTWPVDLGRYANLSGTSMAAPFVAGTAALMLESEPSLTPAGLAQRLYNTADPIPSSIRPGLDDRAEAVFAQGAGLVNVEQALSATVTARPDNIRLAEGGCQKVSVKLTNTTNVDLVYKPSRITGVSAAASTNYQENDLVGTTTPDYAFGDAGFKAYSPSVQVRAGGSATIKVRICPPATILKGRPGMLYGGWLQFATDAGGNRVTVAFHGVRGDYQSVRVLNRFNGASPYTPRSLVTCNQLECSPGSGTVNFQSSFPGLAYHLDYPASDLRLRAINTRTGRAYDAAMTWRGSAPWSVHGGLQWRDASVQATVFLGIVRNGRGWRALPNGSYKLQLRVLKPLGKAGKRSHWETWTSQSFKVDWNATASAE